MYPIFSKSVLVKEKLILDYKKKAIDCVKDTVLPIQRAQFEECGCSLDEQYKKYGNTESNLDISMK